MTVARFWTNTSPELIIRAAQKIRKPKKGKGGGGGGWSGRGGKGGLGGGNSPLIIPEYLWYRIDITAVNGGNSVACDELELVDALGVNLALGTARTGTASANSTHSWTGAAIGLYQVEGDEPSGSGAGWMTASGSTGWTKWIDDSTIECTSVALNAGFNNRMVRDFTIQYSDNGSDWTTAFTIVDTGVWANKEHRIYSWTSVGAHRYWKLDCTRNWGDSLLAIKVLRYITASGEIISSVKRKATVDPTNFLDSGTMARKMFNDDAGAPGNTTLWRSAAGTTNTLLIHTGVATKLASIKWWISKQSSSWQPTFMPKDFTVEGSNDGTNFDLLLTVTDETSWVEDPITFSLI